MWFSHNPQTLARTVTVTATRDGETRQLARDTVRQRFFTSQEVDLLARSAGLEVAAHGSGHLRDLPEVPVVQKKKVHDHKEVRQVLSHVAGVGAVHAVL